MGCRGARAPCGVEHDGAVFGAGSVRLARTGGPVEQLCARWTASAKTRAGCARLVRGGRGLAAVVARVLIRKRIFPLQLLSLPPARWSPCARRKHTHAGGDAVDRNSKVGTMRCGSSSLYLALRRVRRDSREMHAGPIPLAWLAPAAFLRNVAALARARLVSSPHCCVACEPSWAALHA